MKFALNSTLYYACEWESNGNSENSLTPLALKTLNLESWAHCAKERSSEDKTGNTLVHISFNSKRERPCVICNKTHATFGYVLFTETGYIFCERQKVYDKKGLNIPNYNP